MVDGKVPRNSHGNVDLFTMNMLPHGCTHITLPGAEKVAKEIGIDFATACIGFSFHGGRAAPDINGIVICQDQVDNFNKYYEEKWKAISRNEELARYQKSLNNWSKAIDAIVLGRKLKANNSTIMIEQVDNVPSIAKSSKDIVKTIFQSEDNKIDENSFESL